MSLTEVEFEALRRTIATRGTVRVTLFPLTVLGWATASLSILAFDAPPVSALLSLAVLASGFEAIHALHVGVERIGRYLQVYYERPDGPLWETTAMSVGPPLPGGGIDPLFTIPFCILAILNLIPALLPPRLAVEFSVITAFHLAFLVRIVRARSAAAQQRVVELQAFKTLRGKDSRA